MAVSKWNQEWYDKGRAQRLAEQLKAHQTKTSVQLPLATHHATAFSFWRKGWNSVTLDEIKQHIRDEGKANSVPLDYLAKARSTIKGTTS